MLDLRAGDLAILADGGVRADVAVDEARAGADDRGPAHDRSLQPRAGLDDDAPVDARVDQLALDALAQAVEDQAVGLEHVLEPAGVLPPSAHDVRLDAQAGVEEVLDRVGDLELSARRWRDRARGIVDLLGEHVHADEREVGVRLRGLLDEAHDSAGLGAVGGRELGDAVVLGIGNGREQDEGVGRALAEGGDELRDPALQEVVPEIHHERARAEERLGGKHRVGEPERLVLDDVAHAHAEARAVADGAFDLGAGVGRDHDADLLDRGGGHRLDAVEEHGLVRDGHELLGARVRDRAKARALAPGQD